MTAGAGQNRRRDTEIGNHHQSNQRKSAPIAAHQAVPNLIATLPGRKTPAVRGVQLKRSADNEPDARAASAGNARG